MRSSLLHVFVAFVVACGGCKVRKAGPTKPTSQPSSSGDLSTAIAEKLEEAFNAAEKAHPDGLPECGPHVKGPCSMKTTSEIGYVKGEAVTSQGDALPPSLHKSGEALRGAWLAPDGTAF